MLFLFVLVTIFSLKVPSSNSWMDQYTNGLSKRGVQIQTKSFVNNLDDDDDDEDNKDALLKAVGQGKGKHARYSKRIRRNKYASKAPPDPFQSGMQEYDKYQESLVAEENLKKRSMLIHSDQNPRSVRLYDPSQFDPYDPNTFGYVIFGIMEEAQGLKGAMKIRVTSDFAKERLVPGKELFLKPYTKKLPKPYLITSCYHFQKDRKYMGSHQWIVHLNGIIDRNSASRLNGQEVYVWKTDREELLKKNEYFVSELVGLPVFRAKVSHLNETMQQVVKVDMSYTGTNQTMDAMLYANRETNEEHAQEEEEEAINSISNSRELVSQILKEESRNRQSERAKHKVPKVHQEQHNKTSTERFLDIEYLSTRKRVTDKIGDDAEEEDIFTKYDDTDSINLKQFTVEEMLQNMIERDEGFLNASNRIAPPMIPEGHVLKSSKTGNENEVNDDDDDDTDDEVIVENTQTTTEEYGELIGHVVGVVPRDEIFLNKPNKINNEVEFGHDMLEIELTTKVAYPTFQDLHYNYKIRKKLRTKFELSQYMRKPYPKRCFIPLVHPIIRTISLLNQYIICDPPVGLLEVAVVVKPKRAPVRGYLTNFPHNWFPFQQGIACTPLKIDTLPCSKATALPRRKSLLPRTESLRVKRRAG